MGTKCPQCQMENSEQSKFCAECGSRLFPPGEVLFGQTMTLETGYRVLSKGKFFAGKYAISGEIGRGGMGVVYKAEDTKLKRTVALKFLPPELGVHPEVKERFIREAQAAAALSHPNICTIHEVEEAEGQPYIAMEYVGGESLRQKLAKGPLDSDTAADIAVQVASGLEAAHQRGIIHRDIKSANIMVTEKGQAKVMDFGLAKVAGESQLTKEARTIGTIAYMSPEQAQGEDLDHRTDLWSFGVVLYEMLTGQLPFRGERESIILHSIVGAEPKPLRQLRSDIPVELQKIVDRALKKRREDRYASAAEMAVDLGKYLESRRAQEAGFFNLRSLVKRLRNPLVAIPAALVLIGVAFLTVWFFNRRAKIRWARAVAVPQIKQMIEKLDAGFMSVHIEAYQLAEEAEKYIPKDTQLAELFASCSKRISVTSEPPGANVFVKPYSNPEREWQYLGVTPLGGIRMPHSDFRWKFEKEGYEQVLAADPTFDMDLRIKGILKPYDIVRKLDKKGTIPPGMVRVAGAETAWGKVADFYIDSCEITNSQYKEFIESGGYREPKYWKHPFIKEVNVLTWKQAIKEFVDQTGQPGPSTWSAGDYPRGQERHPVSGVSWYEAAAYAEFAGKSLPTGLHWGMACGEFTPLLSAEGTFSYRLSMMSNFKAEGPVAVGSSPGMTAYGAMDMAGNVREWCSNEIAKGRLVRGGAWNDADYMFDVWSQALPFDRSPKNGFRCALYPDREKIPAKIFEPVALREETDFYKLTPVPDSVFQTYKEQFSYDKTDLNASVEWTNEESRDWTREKITLDAAYGNERVPAYLFLPKNVSPPFQTVVYFPGGSSSLPASSQELDKYWEFEIFLSFIVKNGRAVLYPIYQGTFERQADSLTRIRGGADTHQYTEYLIQVIKDLKRCIDYLETRADINSQKIAFIGMSWGAFMGPIILAVEERIKANILVLGGLSSEKRRPEADAINYIRHIKSPTLMLNGRYDVGLRYETKVKPMLDLLGTPAEKKKSILYDTDHYVPRNELIKETLAWLDKYLGPVKGP